ncbi:MAG TPA: hypothetical protein VN682_08550 [Terriglobales bacterium]|nr:hypothetical protein [Terriglobales bacterium]HXF12558.1 hypothetical protein [Terriglobales bacterium]
MIPFWEPRVRRHTSRIDRILSKSLIAICAVVLWPGFLDAQSASQLVNRMVQNELGAAKNDHSYWMYQDSNTDKGRTTIDEVLQTPEGWMRRLVSVNGKPPTPDEEKKSEDELHKFLSDPDYRKQEHEKVLQDGKKATDLLSMLPSAFLYTARGRQGRTIRFSFRPNPKFHPPTREAKVFHSMAGMLLIDSKDMRLMRLSGHLIEDVDFGFGILGKLSKGGTFEVDQADVGGGHWEMTKLDVHISGHALFFATIKEQQHEIMTGFHEVPPGTTLAEAAEMLKRPTESSMPGRK